VVVDLAILFLLAVSAAVGAWRGFVRESLSLVAWILAFWVAFHFLDRAELLFAGYVDELILRRAAAFTALFLGTLLAVSIASAVLYRMFSATGITGTDRTLGGLFGLARGAVIIGALILAAGATPLPDSDWWGESALAPRFTPLAQVFNNLLPPDLARHFLLRQ